MVLMKRKGRILCLVWNMTKETEESRREEANSSQENCKKEKKPLTGEFPSKI